MRPSTSRLILSRRPTPRLAPLLRRHKHTHNPLRPSVPISDLALPLTPMPAPAPIAAAQITRPMLLKLCRMSALNPPAEGSEEEAKLLEDLGELVGLMDLVGGVEMDVGVGELLSAGVGEVVFSASEGEEGKGKGKGKIAELMRGREEGGERGEGPRLLEYATRRVGELYGFKAEPAEK